MDTQDILHLVQNAGVRLVRFLYCDNGGIIRGKATHVRKRRTVVVWCARRCEGLHTRLVYTRHLLRSLFLIRAGVVRIFT
jgi:hypothetical protein